MKTIQDFAALLDGREYKKEMTEDEIIQARKLGFVIVFGCSDDRTVFHGAIEEERQTVDGGTLYITEKGLFEDCPCNCIYSQEAKEKASPIEVRWCKGPMSGPTELRSPTKALRSSTISPQKTSSSAREWCLT